MTSHSRGAARRNFVTRETGRKLALVSVATLTVMSTMVIAPSLPAMAEAFADTPNADLLVKLTLTTPAIAIAAFAPLAGWFIDRYGRLPMLYLSMTLFGAAGAAGYFLEDLYAILASRVALGMAIAGSMTTTQTLAGDYFHGEARVRFAGLQSAVMSFGAMFLVGIAGWIADHDWRGPFLLYLYAWLLIPLAAWLLDEPPRVTDRPADAADQPLKGRELALVYALAWFSAAMFYMVAAQLPFLLRERGIASGVLLGLAVGVVQLFAAAGSYAHRRVKEGRPFLAVYGIAFVLMGAGYTLIWWIPTYAVVVASAMIVGIGVGLFFPNSALWVLSIAPPRVRGRASGGLSASLNLGQFASPLALQPAVAAVGVGGAFGLTGGVLLCAAALILFLPRGLAARRGGRP